jgi:ABC-type branched-subunit amino acid transport system permease subunit
MTHQRWLRGGVAGVLILLAASVPAYRSSLLLGVATTTAIYMLLGYGVSLYAYLGTFSFGIGGFVAISSYIVAIADNRGWPLGLAEIAALLIPALVSWSLAPLFFRLRGIYFALISFAFAALVQQIAVGWTGVTGGTQGLTFLPDGGPVPGLGNTPTSVYLICVICAIVAMFLLSRFRRSKAGKRAVALGGDVAFARSLGIGPGGYQRWVSAAAGLIGGLAGIFYAFSVGFVVPNEFGTEISLIPVAAVIVGGVRYPSASLVGVILTVFIPQALNLSPFVYTVFYACLLIGVILVAPDGLVELGLRLGRGSANWSEVFDTRFARPSRAVGFVARMWSPTRGNDARPDGAGAAIAGDALDDVDSPLGGDGHGA